MKGKLVKRSNGRFDLYKIEDVDQLNTIASSFDNPNGKLSLKNCQAIELGYDLDELAMGYDLYENINFVGQTRAYKAGFQKALEILGDKKFTEYQLNEAIAESWNSCEDNEGETFSDVFQRIKETLQQTEWDVEVETHPREWIKKLDENGCLILKRI